MAESRFPRSLPLPVASRGRRDAVRSLGVLGTALLAALGLAQAPAAPSAVAAAADGPAGPFDVPASAADDVGAARRKKRGKPGPTGPTGPTGPSGSTGPNFVPLFVSGPRSSALGTTTGASVQSIADCGGSGKVLSCAHQIVASDAEILNVIVQAVGPDQALAVCAALLRRTASAGSTAGAKIDAFAICKP